MENAIGTKWLQILKEIAPAIARVIFLHSDSRATLIQLPALQDTAAAIGVQLLPANVHNAAEIERALEAHAGEAHVGLIVPPSSVTAVHRKRIIALAAQHRFPAVYYNRRYPADGARRPMALIRRTVQTRRSYVDRILAAPVSPRVQLQEKFEFVLKRGPPCVGSTPRVMLARADGQNKARGAQVRCSAIGQRHRLACPALC